MDLLEKMTAKIKLTTLHWISGNSSGETSGLTSPPQKRPVGMLIMELFFTNVLVIYYKFLTKHTIY